MVSTDHIPILQLLAGSHAHKNNCSAFCFLAFCFLTLLMVILFGLSAWYICYRIVVLWFFDRIMLNHYKYHLQLPNQLLSAIAHMGMTTCSLCAICITSEWLQYCSLINAPFECIQIIFMNKDTIP
jgi:hypothetical protein